MRLILNQKVVEARAKWKEQTVLGWEWIEPISYGYDQEGQLASILAKAGSDVEDGSVCLTHIIEPEISQDLMLYYKVSTSDAIGMNEYKQESEENA